MMATQERTEKLVVRAFRDEDERAWDAWLQKHERGTFYHRIGWKRIVEKTFGHDAHYRVAEVGGRIKGVLPLFLARSPFVGTNLISVPYAVYGGPLADDEETLRALTEDAKALGRELRVGCLELRYREDSPVDDAHLSQLYFTFIKELPDDPEDCLKQMPKKARAAARQGRDRHELELACGSWYLDDLYRLFHQNKRSLGSPGLPRDHFQALLDEFGDDCVVHVVRKDLRPVAAVMSFRFGDTFLPYYSGKTPESTQWNVDNFLYWQLMVDATQYGHRLFDFGRSRRDTGAFRFKEHQGFEAQPLHYRYHLIRKRTPPHFNPSNPKLNLPRKIWSRMPLWLAQKLSGPLSRYLP